MTVPKYSEAPPYKNHVGNGSATTFDFDFLISSEDELIVYHTDSSGAQTTLVLDTDYSVNETGNENGSYITFPLGGSEYSVLAADETLSNVFNGELEQPSPYGNSSTLNLSNLEFSFDYLTRLVQMLYRQLERSVKVQEGSGVDPDNLISSIETSESNASASAAAAATSESNAGDSETAAANSAAAAAASAASIDLPDTPSDNDFLKFNAAQNKYINRTPAEVRSDIGAITSEEASNFDVSYLTKQFLEFSDKKELTVKAGTKIRFETDEDVRYYNVDVDTTLDVESLLDTGVSLDVGKDYYAYIVKDGSGGSEIKVSLNSTYPDGYAANTSRKIGGFHTLCVNAGTISGHPLSDYSAGDILPCSVWCLSHRPVASPEGMVYVEEIDKWVDIYLQSGTYNVSTGALTTASAYGSTVTDTRPWADHSEDLFRASKRLATDIEFSCFAEGSNQKTAISGAAAPSPKTSGGHVDTASRRMISNYGIEECCGYLWQWLDESAPTGGSSWSNYDSLSGDKGQVYGSIYALLAGGHWGNGASCGSRSRSAAYVRSTASAVIGGRGVSSPKIN